MEEAGRAASFVASGLDVSCYFTPCCSRFEIPPPGSCWQEMGGCWSFSPRRYPVLFSVTFFIFIGGPGGAATGAFLEFPGFGVSSASPSPLGPELCSEGEKNARIHCQFKAVPTKKSFETFVS